MIRQLLKPTQGTNTEKNYYKIVKLDVLKSVKSVEIHHKVFRAD